jgi:hypothetical protein
MLGCDQHIDVSMRLVAKIVARQLHPKVRHYSGMPPEASEGEDVRWQMPSPSGLLIEAKDDGVFLYRFAADGQFAGDTWHESVSDAQEQASFEFEMCHSKWIVVPEMWQTLLHFA